MSSFRALRSLWRRLHLSRPVYRDLLTGRAWNIGVAMRVFPGLNLPDTKVGSPLLDSAGECTQEHLSFGPVDASIGDALSMDNRLSVDQRLRSSDEITFDHDAHDATIPARELIRHVAAYCALFAVVFTAVRMAGVDHDAWLDAYLFHLLSSRSHGLGIVVRGLPAAAQDDVAIRISRRQKDCRLSSFRGA